MLVLRRRSSLNQTLGFVTLTGVLFAGLMGMISVGKSPDQVLPSRVQLSGFTSRLPALLPFSRLDGLVPQSSASEACSGVTEIPSTECEALVALYESTDGENWQETEDWLQTSTPCSWYGVSCSDGHVSGLNLFENHLVGSLPSQIGDLTYLTNLNLGWNQLSGEIPYSIINLTGLNSLYISDNMLTASDQEVIDFITALEPEALVNQCNPSIQVDLGTNGINSFYFCQSSVTYNIYSQQGGDLWYSQSVSIVNNSAYLRPGYHQIDLTPGVYIEAIGDQESKSISLVVPPLGITDIDYEPDAVFGFAPPGQQVSVYLADCGRDVQTGADGQWQLLSPDCDFPEDEMVSVEFRPGRRSIDFTLWPPSLEPDMQRDTITAWYLIPDSPVVVEVFDAPDGLLLFGSENFTTGSDGLLRVSFEETNLDLDPGMYLRITEQKTGRQFGIPLWELKVNSADFSAMQMSGTGVPFAELEVYLRQGNARFSDTTTVGEGGYWSTDVSGVPIDTSKFFLFYVWDYDENDRNDMLAELHPYREITAGLVDDLVALRGFPPSASLALSINQSPGGALLYSTQITADSRGGYQLTGAQHGVNLAAGMQVQVSSGSLGIDESLVLSSLTLDALDQVKDVAAGTAPPGEWMQVVAGETQGDRSNSPSLRVFAGANGNWQANFGAASIPIRGDTVVRAYVFDADGDRTLASLPAQAEFCDNVSVITPAECAALETLFHSTGGDSWTDRSGWLDSPNPCSWFGVGCYENDRVVTLNLSDNNLVGSLPMILGDLRYLQHLYLGWNQLSGLIPYSLIYLYDLETLNLENNTSLTSPSQEVLDFVFEKQGNCAPSLNLNMNNDMVRASGFCQAAVTLEIYEQQGGEKWFSHSVPLRGYQVSFPFRLHNVDLREDVYVEVTGDQDGTSYFLTLPDLSITGIDYKFHQISGTGPVDSQLEVEAGDCYFSVPTSPTGEWILDYSSCDLPENEGIWVGYTQGQVRVGYGQWTPVLEAGPDPDEINGFNFFPGALVNLQVLDGPEGDVLLDLEDIPAALHGNWRLDRYSTAFDLQPSMLISVTELTTDRQFSTLVSNLNKSAVDIPSLTMSGTAQPQVELEASVLQFGDDWFFKHFPTGLDGNWSVDLSSARVDPGQYYLFYVVQYDENRNDTYVSLHPDREISADLATGDVTLKWFPVSAQLTVKIYQSPGGTLLSSGQVTTDAWGQFKLTNGAHGVDLLPGMQIQATNPSLGISESLLLADISVDVFDVQGDKASGTAPAGSYLTVNLGDLQAESVYGQNLRLTASPDGDWQAHFDAASLDLTAESVVRLSLYDADGDRTLFSKARELAFCEKVTQIPQSECEALLAFYESTNGDGWLINTGWLETYTPCFWFGVSCYRPIYREMRHVGSLRLRYNNLSGFIPSDIDDLSYLLALNLEENQLTGSIPAALGNLPELQYLNLSFNQLEGNLPAEIGDLSELMSLNLWSNQLSGPIPASLGNLRILYELNLMENHLSGGLPVALLTIDNLDELLLNSNELNGIIPPEISNMEELQVLALGDNQFNGGIPVQIGDMKYLQELSLWDNQLTGSIPSQLGNILTLERIFLQGNQLSGEIPASLANLANLTALDLSTNDLDGYIPPEFSALTKLEYLYLHNNHLQGFVPAWLSNFSALRGLDLSRNLFNGLVPSDLGGLSNLWQLSLAQNQLGGELPASLAGLDGLTDLDLGYNKFSAADSDLLNFLAERDSDWQNTQTVPPAGLSVSVTSPEAVNLSWSPILYTADGGGYEVYRSDSQGGAFLYQGSTTGKLSTSYPFSGLSPDTLYTFRLRTFTPAHDTQQNDLWSADSAGISYQYTSLPPDQDETVVYQGSQGQTTTLEIPAGALSEPTTLAFADSLDPTPPQGFQFAGAAFEVTASQGGQVLDELVFDQPVGLTIAYTDEQVSGLDEADLLLYVWDEAASQWVDAALTCSPASAYLRNPDENWLQVSICHLSQFALFEQSLLDIFLPVVVRP